MSSTVPRLSGEYGDTPYGGGEYGGHRTGLTGYTGVLHCAPVTVSTVKIYTTLGAVYDDGVGNLTGQGSGVIDYRTGAFTVLFDQHEIGLSVMATYKPQEGGCDCGSCKTHKFRLIVVPGTNIGANQITVSDAFKRLLDKLKTITPIHAVWAPIVLSEKLEISVVHHFDQIVGDVEVLDVNGLRVETT